MKNYTSEQIKAMIDSDVKHIDGIRLLAIYQMSLGKPSRELEKLYNVSFKQICTWADRFDANGLAGLRNQKRGGRKSRLQPQQLEQLRQDLLKSPEDFGFNTGTWSGPLVGEHVRRYYGVDYKPAAVYNLMHGLGFSYQRARGRYPEQDQAKRSEAKRDIKKL